MALDDIKKAILDEAQKEVEKIKQDGDKKVAEVNVAWDKKIDEKKQETVAIANRKTNQKVQQTKFKVQTRAQTEVLNQKQFTIDKVYKLALQKLAEIDDDKYVDLMEKLINQLPEGEGELTSAKDKENLLKKALHKSGKKYAINKTEINGSGGFIFRSKEVEINNTFSTLVSNAKEQTVLAVSDLLFNREQK